MRTRRSSRIQAKAKKDEEVEESTKSQEMPDEQCPNWFDLDLDDEDNFRRAAIYAFGLNKKPCEKSMLHNILFMTLLIYSSSFVYLL